MSGPTGYAVLTSDGYFVGIWRDRECAELIVNRSQAAKDERIVEYVPAATLHAKDEEIARLRAALTRHGYREHCDIPACNCGNQWNHGGHAAERLREISDALQERETSMNGKTLLQGVQECVAAESRIRDLEAALREAREAFDAIASDYDCDADAHRYGTACRACAAGNRRDRIDALLGDKPRQPPDIPQPDR